jgi:hypothetical protein
MAHEHILSLLVAERDKISNAIAALGGGIDSGGKPASASAGAGGGKATVVVPKKPAAMATEPVAAAPKKGWLRVRKNGGRRLTLRSRGSVIYLKSVLAGLAAVVLAAVILVSGFFFAPVVLHWFDSSESGGIGANIIGFSFRPLIAAAAVIFITAAAWMFKKASKHY